MNVTPLPRHARLEHDCPTSALLLACCYEPKSKTLFGAGLDSAVYAVDPFAEKPAATKRWTHHENYVSALAAHEGVVISSGYDRRLIWTHATTGEKLRQIDAHEGWVRDLTLVGRGESLATIGDDMQLKLWETSTGKLIRHCDGHEKKTPQGFATALYAVAASADGKLLATGDRLGHVCVWEAETGKRLVRLQAEAFYTFDAVARSRSIGGIRALAFLPDGRLAIGGIGKVTNVDGFVGPCRVEVWNWSTGQRVYLGQDKHQAIFDHLAWHAPSNQLVAAGGGDAGPILASFDLTAEAPVFKAKPKSHIHHFEFDPLGERLWAVGHSGFQLWALTAET